MLVSAVFYDKPPTTVDSMLPNMALYCFLNFAVRRIWTASKLGSEIRRTRRLQSCCLSSWPRGA